MLDLDVLGPDWRFAELHGMASRTGYNKYDQNDNDGIIICRCCLNIVHQKQVPLCVHSKELEFLGFGFPLFYAFVKNCILLLIVMIFSYNAISLFTGIRNNNETICADGVGADGSSNKGGFPPPQCKTFMELLARNELKVTPEQNFLRIIGFAIYFIFLVYIRNDMVKLEEYYRERSTDISDFAIIIKNLPRMPNIRKKIIRFFNSAFKKPYNIHELTLLAHDPQIHLVKNEKKNLIKQISKKMKKRGATQEQLDAANSQLDEVNEKLQQLFDQYDERLRKDTLEATRAIVIVRKEEEKMQVIREFARMEDLVKVDHFGVEGRKVTMKQSPEPREIIWMNMIQSNPSFHVLRMVLGWFLTLVVLAIVTVIFFFVLRIKGKNMKYADKNFSESASQGKLYEAVALVYVMLFLVIIFNKLILVEILHKFVHLEKHTSTAGYQSSFATKYCIALFFTTALMTLAVEAFSLKNYNSYLYGVIDEQTVMFFLNSAFVPLFWLINPKHLLKVARRHFKYGRQNMTQRQANDLMEHSSYDIGKRYAQVIEIMWFTTLYCSLIPVGAMASLVGLCIYYWVDRYNLLRRSAIKYKVSGKMVRLALKLLDFSLILRPVGQILFDEQIRDGYQISSLVMLIFALVYQVLPVNQIINRVNSETFYLEQKTYDEVRFKDTYHNLHPIEKHLHHKQIEETFVDMNIILSSRALKSEPDREHKDDFMGEQVPRNPNHQIRTTN